ncbi:hypothetical protein DFA_10547 [Cavenderia fasciculata]|uniref:Complex 1 LYR protein domain-containing protein n=1 Tax=Cavenderia fasciculata TaxID=261658 RepID=F4QAI6_CACFS|nr:uncharacterized protein DFA_10547 [Cavenderia fasciculata]EGG15705.1 hypothetical protein DFA_10547 [Cavenderia fasciculata]|eukprot:XP_004354447.1 hypothetical protein DFA_10547 [Cavenderia fasciculata]
MSSSIASTAATTLTRHSGVQKQVLSLYRNFIRQSKHNSEVVSQESSVSSPSDNQITNYIKDQFRTKSKSISKRDITKIEALISRGKRQLETLKNTSGFSVVSTTTSTSRSASTTSN